MNKIRIIHCLGKLDVGGAETLILNVLKKIDRDRFQFDFLLFNDACGFYDDEVKQLGCNIYYVPSISDVGILKYIKYLIMFFKDNSPDIVHSHMDWQGGFIAYAAYKAGIKKIIVHSHANQKMFDLNIVYHCLIRLNKKLISKYATHCLACSRIAGDSLFLKNYTVLFNGIDTNKYIKPNKKIINDLKKEFNIKKNEIILGNVGSMSDNKNQIFLIDLLYELHKKNKNFRLILVGDGGQKENLVKKVQMYNLDKYVYFTGIRKDIPEMMHLFDIFLLPSKTEGLGIVAIEAQISGIYCIVSNTIPHDVIVDKDGIQFVPLEVNNWIEAISDFEVSDKSKKLKDYSNFDIKRTTEVLEKIYD